MLEKTLIIAKPDAVQRALVGEIIRRFEVKGFRLVGLKFLTPDQELLGLHYADDPVWKKSVGEKTRASMAKKGVEMSETDEEIGARIRSWNMECLKAPLVAMVFEGYHACEVGRKIVGSTAPKDAAPGTIRGDYSSDSFVVADEQKRVIKNLVHASGSVEEAEREIKLWFKENELVDYTKFDMNIIHG